MVDCMHMLLFDECYLSIIFSLVVSGCLPFVCNGNIIEHINHVTYRRSQENYVIVPWATERAPDRT